MKFLVAQLGARMHYAVPRMLQAAGQLDRLCTDICAVKGLPRLLGIIPPALRPAPIKRLLGRVPRDIPRSRIVAFTEFGRDYARRRARARSPAQATAAHLWAGKTFCDRIIRSGIGEAAGVYAFNSAGLELMLHARDRGLRTVLEQTIAPMQFECDLMRTEQQRFPGWQGSSPENDLAAEFIAREKAEWAEADLVVCGSEFVRDSIARCGGDSTRCAVVPYGVDASFEVPWRPRSRGPLRVLTVGEIGLRKGSPYVLEAARSLGKHAQFRMVGSLKASPAAQQDLRAHVEITGPVPRAEILKHYAWADVFLLPSICEGSATVTYEALACGLPVITTPNTGSIVRDGVDGFVVPIADSTAIAASLETFVSAPGRLVSFSTNALLRAKEGSLAAYARRLSQSLALLTHSPVLPEREAV